MKTTTALSLPQATGQDAYDWIGAEDVVRHALSAFYGCCRESDAWPADPGDPEDLTSRHNHIRREFAEAIGLSFTERVFQSGVDGRIPSFQRSASENTQEVLSGPGFPIIGDTHNIHRELSHNGTEGS